VVIQVSREQKEKDLLKLQMKEFQKTKVRPFVRDRTGISPYLFAIKIYILLFVILIIILTFFESELEELPAKIQPLKQILLNIPALIFLRSKKDTQEKLTFYYQKRRYSIPTGREKKTSKQPLIAPIPDKYRFSTRRLDYNPRNFRTPIKRVPYLFDHSEVKLGYYTMPRFYLVGKKLLLAPLENWGHPVNVTDFNVSGVYPAEFVTNKVSYKGQVKIPRSVNIKAWRNYSKNQCNTSIIVGRMGSGKSMLMNYLINLVLGKDEAVIMGTDTFLEPRHLALAGKIYDRNKLPHNIEAPQLELFGRTVKYTHCVILHNIEVFVHKDSNLEWVNKKFIDLPNIKVSQFSSSIEIVKAMAKSKVVAVYDENITPETQNKLWFEIAVMLNRRKDTETTVTLAHHEASKLLPSHPSKGKFEDVQNFANEYVHFRKAEVRVIFAQQLLTESYWRTNKKTTYIFFKIGSRKDAISDRRQRNKVQTLSLDKYILEKDGWWSEHNSPKFVEMEKQVKVVSNNIVRYESLYDEKNLDLKGYIPEKQHREILYILVYRLLILNKINDIKQKRKNDNDQLLKRSTIADIFGIGEGSISNWYKKGEVLSKKLVLEQQHPT
jgi:hypothetical protein